MTTTFINPHYSKIFFGDLKTEKSLKLLNIHLEQKSYVKGYTPTQADIDTIRSLEKLPTTSIPHVLRWFNHMQSYSVEELEQMDLKPPEVWPVKLEPPSPPTEKFVMAPIPQTRPPRLNGKGDITNGKTDSKQIIVNNKKGKTIAPKKKIYPKFNLAINVVPKDRKIKMSDLDKTIKTINEVGLMWGTSKLIAGASDLNTLQVTCVIQPEKITSMKVVDEILKFKNFVQSANIVCSARK